MCQNSCPAEFHSLAWNINNSKLIKYFPFLFVGLMISFKLFSQGLYWSIFCAEDGLVEYLTAVAYLVASLFVIRNAWGIYRESGITRSSLVAIGVAAFLFFIAMEEISWGQRIFNVSSPEFFEEYNRQGEITLHNLLSRRALGMAFILTGLYGAFAWKYFPSKIRKKYPEVVQFLIPDRNLKWYFLPVAILYFYYHYISPFFVHIVGLSMFEWSTGKTGWIISRDQEPIEFLLALGFMLFTLSLMSMEKQKRRSRKTAEILK